MDNNTAQKTGSEAASLESMPHVKAKLCSLWQTTELDDYLSTLIVDDRHGERKGFPMEAMGELLFLTELNKMVRAIDLADKLQIPLQEAYRKVDLQDRGSKHLDVYDALFDPMAKGDKDAAANRRRTVLRELEEPEGGSNLLVIVVVVIAVIAGLLFLF